MSDLPSSVKGIWLYLYQVLDVLSRKVLAWDGEISEDPKVAGSLADRVLEKLRAATLELRLEELGMVGSFSRPGISNDNP